MKFCLINTDKSKNIFGQIDEINRLKAKQEQADEQEQLKEKYDCLLQLQRQVHGKGINAYDKTKELKQIK